ncbi:MAG: hypothetical protein KIT84_20610 [Labilithrix sp.]|nr:hypothetical protein [Labilithrix sp.]MCW5813443.1 hypothetical protein [Labilithrix sp.]
MKRKAVAAASMLGAAGVVAWESLRHWHVEWLPLAFAGVLGVSALGITRRSLVAQVLSRGAAWVTLFPMAIVFLAQIFIRHHIPDFTETALTATTATALALSAPMLRTKEALASFAPKAYRRLLLAGSTATAATAFLTGGIALELAGASSKLDLALSVPFAGLTLALLASAIGVVRMRSWGIFLGAATGIVLLVAAVFAPMGWNVLLPFIALPMLSLHLLPILLARKGFGQEKPAPAMRVGAEEPTARYRVAIDDEELALDEPAFTPERVALRSH